MCEWFQAKVKFLRQMDNGLIKKITESYLVDSISFAECEARVMEEVGEGMREVTMMAVAKSNIKEVVFYGDTDMWFKCKVCYAMMDEDTEKEKKVSTYVLVNASDAREAIDRCAEHFKEMLVPFTIPKVEESPIIDVYEYQRSSFPRHVRDKASDLKGEAAGGTKPDPADGKEHEFQVADKFDPQYGHTDGKSRNPGLLKLLADAGFTATESNIEHIEHCNSYMAIGTFVTHMKEEFNIEGATAREAWDLLYDQYGES